MPMLIGVEIPYKILEFFRILLIIPPHPKPAAPKS